MMTAPFDKTVRSVGPALVLDLTARRIERALSRRVRYRYVQPHLTAGPTGWIVSSPCCSRNVDPEGGDILIAWFERLDDGWAVHWRAHSQDRWVLHSQADSLAPLLDVVCRDEERIFWP